MKRSAPLRRTRMRRIGPKGRAKAKRLDAIRPLIEARARGRCENPTCRKAARLDLDHIVKRSQGGRDTPENIIGMDRRCHNRRDLPADHPRYLQVEAFQDALGRWFALFFDGKIALNVPLAVP